MNSTTVNEEYQVGYKYRLSEPIGKNYDARFKLDLSAQQLLKMGILVVTISNQFLKNSLKVGLMMLD